MQQWQSIGGNRLAYGATGFEIELNDDPQKEPYLLHDPDGRVLAGAFMLSQLKQFAEELAAERAEFNS